MSKYAHYSDLNVSDETLAEFKFLFIPGEPSIWLAPAIDTNELYYNEAARIRTEVAAKVPDGAKTDPREEARRDANIDRRIIAKACAKRWGTPPIDIDGNSPEFSEQECLDFLNAIPDWGITGLRNFVVQPFNFAKLDRITELAARKMGNGSGIGSSGN